MPPRRRKSMAVHPHINCRVKADTKLFLIQSAGDYGIGHAVDRLVEEIQRLRNATLTQPANTFSNSGR